MAGGFDGGAGGLDEGFEGVDEVFAVAGFEATAVGVVVAEGGDAVVGEGLGHVVHEGARIGVPAPWPKTMRAMGLVGWRRRAGRWGPEGDAGKVLSWRFMVGGVRFRRR